MGLGQFVNSCFRLLIWESSDERAELLFILSYVSHSPSFISQEFHLFKDFFFNCFQSLSLVLYTLFPIVLVTIIAGFRPALDFYYPHFKLFLSFPSMIELRYMEGTMRTVRSNGDNVEGKSMGWLLSVHQGQDLEEEVCNCFLSLFYNLLFTVC